MCRFQASAGPPRRARPNGPPIACQNPHCLYYGPSLRKPNGSFAVALFLMLFLFVPGLIYVCLCHGYSLICPKCGVKARNE